MRFQGPFRGPLSLPRKIAFPDGGDRKGSLLGANGPDFLAPDLDIVQRYDEN